MEISFKTDIEEVKISSLTEILDLLKKNKHFEFFRGQSDSNWRLVPKLFRGFNNSNPPDSWDRIESSMLEDFKKYSIPYIDKEPLLGVVILWRYKPRVRDELILGPLNGSIAPGDSDVMKHKRWE